jgi:hypothetical protein
MSTRATYEFVYESDGEVESRTFVYVHYDNYPEGAAAYFYETLANPSKGNFATQFIRANSGAEITKSHEYHGDTEYKYIVTGTGPRANVKCYSIKRSWTDKEDISELEFDGNICNFIENNKNMIKGHHPFKEVSTRGSSQLMNLHTAKKYLESDFGPLHNLRVWKGKFEKSSNWKSSAEDVKSVVETFPELMTDEIKIYFNSK